jgi:hypothetical protein
MNSWTRTTPNERLLRSKEECAEHARSVTELLFSTGSWYQVYCFCLSPIVEPCTKVAPALLERCGYVTSPVHLVHQLHLTTTMSVQKIKKASGVSVFERNIGYFRDRIESSCFSRLLHFNDVISPVLSLIMLGTR